jgi:hypothetical protein
VTFSCGRSIHSLSQEFTQIALIADGPPFNRILIPFKDGVSNLCSFQSLFFVSQHIADKFAWRGVKRSITAIAIDESPEFIRQGQIERAAHENDFSERFSNSQSSIV